jgi:hypothetical protein
MKIKRPEYFLYYIDKHGDKKYYLGDGKFVTWLNSEVGCTKFDRYDEAANAWEQVHETESLVSIDFH